LAASALTIDDGIVFEQISGRSRDTSLREVGRARHDQAVGLRQFAGRQCRISKNAQTQACINVFRQQINAAVVHNKFQPKLRMGIQKFADPGNYVQPREGDRRPDPQPPFESCPGAPGGSFRFVRFRDRVERPLIECQACFCWRQPASRPDQKPHAQSFFQPRNRFGYGRLAHVQVACRGRERAGFHDPYKHLHVTQPTHSIHSVVE